MKTLTTIVNNLCDLEMVAKPDIDSGELLGTKVPSFQESSLSC
ncbi:hypothetical protein [Photobacterium carnosum]|nr:hypothetical protein [Photobacterium carnosum]